MAPRLWRAIVGDQQAPNSETHPGDHHPVWEPLGDEWRVCEHCGHIDGGGRWDRLIVKVVMFWTVCLFVAMIGYWVFSVI